MTDKIKKDIGIHPLTDDPTAAWKVISKQQKLLKLNVKLPTKPVENDKIRFVCMSDTHSLIRNIIYDIPDGDIFIHAGDFTKCGQKEEVIQFNEWLGSLPHRYKIVIAGNHELSFDKKFKSEFKLNNREKRHNHTEKDEIKNYGNTKDDILDSVNTQNIQEYLTNCIYLEDCGVELYGIKLYGSPWKKVVEIDEAKFGRRKYNKGRVIEGKWIFGGIERETKTFFMEPVMNRTKEVLLEVIKRRIKPGTTIISDCWKTYDCLNDEGFKHLTVNHSLNFVGTHSGAHTQNIERTWRTARTNIPKYGSKEENMFGQPEFGNWAFNLKRGEECLSKWKNIPDDVDILITHTPPLGHGDLVCSGIRAGCVELLNTVQQRVQPKYHVFGHIHEGYGVTSDGKIIYINASTCDINYIPKNLPIVFDVPLKKGFEKE